MMTIVVLSYMAFKQLEPPSFWVLTMIVCCDVLNLLIGSLINDAIRR
jgi:hypothetical protein